MIIETVNPTTGNIIRLFELDDSEMIQNKIQQGDMCYQHWRKTSFSDRREKMLLLAQQLRRGAKDYIHLMACEMGKPVSAGKLEIEKCAFVCEHYAENAEHYLMPRNIHTESGERFVCYQPLGIIFAIMPWNFPFWQVFRFAAPTIMAGNAAILKHAPISSGTGEAIVHLFLEAGFPPHLFQQLIIDNEGAASVIAHPKVAAVTLTGSDQAGRSVASHAGQHLKKCVLELGGNDPYIVLADADLHLAAQCIVSSRLNNTGQVCIAAKRIIVVREVETQLVHHIQKIMSDYVIGDPLSPDTKLGPLARADLREKLHQQVLNTVREGAHLIAGGVIPDGAGYFYPPTILTGVRPGMCAFEEELFGPVFSIVTAMDESDAIALANQSQYGLSAAVFTADVEKGKRIASQEIEVGTCYVNAFVASDPRIPFGGIKSSGYGRELSQEGILEFMNIKSIGIGA